MSKVVIGIVTKHTKKQEIRINCYIRDEYKQAIYDNGGIAIGIISPNDEILYTEDNWKKDLDKLRIDDIIEQVKLCDGIILQGGSTSEVYEPFIAKYCYENNIPCLGICAGQNNIVRALGGSKKSIINPEKHLKLNDKYVHDVEIIDLNSKFYKIINKRKFRVNSRHKNVINEHPFLNLVGICEDGYNEVLESKEKDFYIGVRFHPESLYKTDENMNNIFKEFINCCKKNKQEK